MIRDYLDGVPIIEKSEISESQQDKIFCFRSRIIKIPANYSYALVANEEGIEGVLVGNDEGCKRKGFKKAYQDTYLVKLCSNFVARRVIPPADYLEAKI